MRLFNNLIKQFKCSIKSLHLSGESRLLLLIILLFNIINLHPQKNVFEIKIWPDGVPYKYNQDKTEFIENRSIEQNEFGLNRSITNVSDPTLTVHLAPKEKANGTAVLIFPGGGYNRIVIDKEGHDVARWLNSEGIAGIVVKYRTAPKGIKIRGEQSNNEIKDAILSDALESLKVVHLKSKEWNLNPDKIGVMGFSAGGHLCASACAILDQLSEKTILVEPRFMGLIYAAIENDFDSIDFKDFPPTFIVATGDDETSPAERNVEIYNSLLKNNILAEIHSYASGGHGFGLGVRGGEVVTWKNCFINWLKASMFL